MARRIPWRQIVLSVGSATVILWRVPGAQLRSAFRSLEPRSLFLAGLSALVLLMLRAYKWHRLMASAGGFRLPQSLRTLLGGCALGLITPGRLGEFGRCMFVRKHERMRIVILTFLDRSLDFWALLTLVGVSLFILVGDPAAVFGLGAWLALLPVLLGLPGLLAYLAKAMPWSLHLHTPLTEVASDVSPTDMVLYATISLAAMAVELSAFFFLLRAFAPAGFSTAVATYPYIALAGDLPFSFSGVGIREGAAAFLLSRYSVSSATAVDATLLWFLLGIVFPAILGTGWLAVEKLKLVVKSCTAKPAETEPHLEPSAEGSGR